MTRPDPCVDAYGMSRDLDFFENKATGTVHVELPDDMYSAGSRPSPNSSRSVWGLLPQARSLCGVLALLDFAGGPGSRLSEFDDERLCARCVSLLPDPSRAFEHPQPGEVEP